MYEKLLADTLDYLVKSGVLQLSSVLIAIIAFFSQYYRDRNNRKVEFRDRIKRISSLLLLDLSALEEGRWKKDDVQKVLTSKGIYLEDHLSTEHYQTMVYSGLITYLKKETQSELTHFYHFITLHNKRMFDMGDMINRRLNSAKFGDVERLDLEESIAWKLNQEQLAIYEKEIVVKIPIIKKLLNEELVRKK